MSSSQQLCVHVLTNRYQALATAPDDNGVQTMFCAPCLSERVEAMLMSQSPESIAHRIAFDCCGHYPPGEVCEVCYVGVAGCLQLIFSRLKLVGDNRTANRVLRLLKVLSKHYGSTNWIGRQRYRASVARSARKEAIYQ